MTLGKQLAVTLQAEELARAIKEAARREELERKRQREREQCTHLVNRLKAEITQDIMTQRKPHIELTGKNEQRVRYWIDNLQKMAADIDPVDDLVDADLWVGFLKWLKSEELVVAFQYDCDYDSGDHTIILNVVPTSNLTQGTDK